MNPSKPDQNRAARHSRADELAESMQRAKSHYEARQWPEAERLARSILARVPGYLDAINLLGIIAAQTNRKEEAAELLGIAAKGLADNASVQNNYGNILKDLKQFEEAVAAYDQAIAILPDFSSAHFNRGVALNELKRFNLAVESFDQAIGLNPAFAGALTQRGAALSGMGMHTAAIECYEKALQIDPDSANVHFHLGNSLNDLGQYTDALAAFEKAIALKPDYAEAHCNLGVSKYQMQNCDEAIQDIRRAISLKPDLQVAHFNLASCLLIAGQFEEGWLEYEWRWQKDVMQSPRVRFGSPHWTGHDSLEGKTILLHSEQGFGDTIQFCRYAPVLRGMGAQVVLGVQSELKLLIQSLDADIPVVCKEDPLPHFDCHCPLMSLPFALGTRLDSVPAGARYLAPTGDALALWAARLGEPSSPRVGIAWSGNPKHKNDRNRSISLAALLDGLVDGMAIFSLQTDCREPDRQTLAAHPEVVHFGDQLGDFVGTAAVCDLMDLVITVDTSVAHLAGALGKPVWLLLPFNPDWRWMQGRDDSPWYAKTRLYRQSRQGHWADVLQRVHADLLHFRAKTGPGL